MVDWKKLLEKWNEVSEETKKRLKELFEMKKDKLPEFFKKEPDAIKVYELVTGLKWSPPKPPAPPPPPAIPKPAPPPPPPPKPAIPPPPKELTKEEISKLYDMFRTELALRGIPMVTRVLKEWLDPTFRYYIEQWKNLGYDRVERRFREILIPELELSWKERKAITVEDIKSKVILKEAKFKVGDWVEHPKYGVVRIKSIIESPPIYEYILDTVGSPRVSEMELEKAKIPAPKYSIDTIVDVGGRGYKIKDMVWDSEKKKWKYFADPVVP